MSEPTRVRNRASRQISGLVDDLCESIGPRASGSVEEGQAARALLDRLGDIGIPSRIESFQVAPSEVHALVLIYMGGYALSYVAYFYAPLITFSILTTLLVIAAINRIFDRDLIETALPKSWSTNVIGRIEPTGTREHVIIFAGHHDSAFRMPMYGYTRLYPLLKALIVTLFASAAVLWLLSLAAVMLPSVLAGVPGVVERVVLGVGGVGAVVAVTLPFGMIRRDAVPGANDNLSAVAVAWEVGRRLAAAPPKHTEVWIASFGSEELGLKGSRDFAAKHRQEVGEALVINLECLGQTGKLNVLTGELPALARHSDRVISLVEEAAVASDLHIQRRLLVPGLTDATSFSRAGIRATTLIRLTAKGHLEHYHVPSDAPANVSEEHLEEALRVCLKAVELLDGSEDTDGIEGIGTASS